VRRPEGMVAPLLFCSGACALVYQTAWLREFRLLFGASTAASAAVLAMFIGGLGMGGLLLGRLADRRPNPLLLYAQLEGAAALLAALTPGLLWLVRRLYVALGGSVAMGLGGATVVRLLLAAVVLLPVTLLMGGTLPAAVRAAASDEDRARRTVGLLYGVNTLGALAGCLLSTFLLLEVLGTRSTLWSACLVNLLVAVTARALSRKLPEAAGAGEAARAAGAAGAGEPPLAPVGFVLAAAGLVGFAFFLMEMVWFRLFGPLLGGTVFAFGLILAMALLGIGVGGALYALRDPRRPATLSGFALTSLLEAVALGIPLLLGDRIAILAILLRPLGSLGFGGFIGGWTLLAAIGVLPAALVAGYQFPLLIALLGRGRRDLGRQIGQAYAWNTVGAIAGSLAGGFGLLPLLTAPGCLRLVVMLLGALGMSALLLSHTARRRPSLLAGAGLGVLAVLVLLAPGPTAAWRHTPIGVGRVAVERVATPQLAQRFLNASRRAIRWQREGVESAVAVDDRNGLSLIVNGKSDGNARNDAANMVMSGLLGPLLHPAAKRALVVGMGTGTTAGWMAAVPTLERLDVVELEPAVLDVAQAASLVNLGALKSPKVHTFIGDAREVLLSTPNRYDVIFSEPSNPYRAGVASLFTREYYQSVQARLTADGLFLQWVQAYDIDNETIQSIIATLGDVFPHVEAWQVHVADFLLVASARPLVHDLQRLRERLAEEPYRSGLLDVWRGTDAEGFLARYVAGERTTRELARLGAARVNTDDQTFIEFAFARSVGFDQFEVEQLRDVARTLRDDRPRLTPGEVNWAKVEAERAAIYGSLGYAPRAPVRLPEPWRQKLEPQLLYLAGDTGRAVAAWRALGGEPVTATDRVLRAEALAEVGDAAAEEDLRVIRTWQPVEADALLARLRLRQGRTEEAAAAMESALVAYRTAPWPAPSIMRGALTVAEQIAAQGRSAAQRMLAALSEPFAVRALDELRMEARVSIARRQPLDARCGELLAPLEPWVPWTLEVLTFRRACAEAHHPEQLARAEADLESFLAEQPLPLSTGAPAEAAR